MGQTVDGLKEVDNDFSNYSEQQLAMQLAVQHQVKCGVYTP